MSAAGTPPQCRLTPEIFADHLVNKGLAWAMVSELSGWNSSGSISTRNAEIEAL